MKYRAAGVLAMVLMLLAVFFATAAEGDNTANRVHQHLTADSPMQAVTVTAVSCAPTFPWFLLTPAA